jgi:hypothetical protein
MSIDPKILERIKKLMNLGANNPEEKEAASALKKAAQLAEEYGLSISDIDPSTGKVSQVEYSIVKTMSTSHSCWSLPLASMVSKCFDCQVIKVQDTLHFLGTPTDIKMCLWFYKMIRIKTIMQAKKKYRLVGDQKQYGMGVYMAISKRMREMYIIPREAERSQNTRDLVVVKNAEVDKKVNELFPRLRKQKCNSPVITNLAAFEKGVEAGRTMGLHTGEINA